MPSNYPTDPNAGPFMTPNTVAAIGSFLNLAFNASNLGGKEYGNLTQPGFKVDSTTSLAGTGMMVGGPVGAGVGAALGLGLDTWKFIEGKKQFKREMASQDLASVFEERRKDKGLMDYTYTT